jgi:molybdenum cofactor biosynthesis enzyme MoaA
MACRLDYQNTTVIDVTYRCNATCRYCQWGNKSNPRGVHRPLTDILLPIETIRALGTQRVVLSGGEPRIHPELERILNHYRNLVEDVIVITNGYGLDSAELQRLLDSGATGITISLDSTHPDEALATRQTPQTLHAEIISDLKQISKRTRTFELGINSVVSNPTANEATVRDLLEFGSELGVDFVKFQPVFDDGYASHNAPDLLLGEADVPELLRIADLLDEMRRPQTNPPGFWTNLASVALRRPLAPESCGLGPRHAIATAGKMNVCYWVDSTSFGMQSEVPTSAEARIVRTNFELAKLGCKVGYHCFCNQNISHEWRTKGASVD